MERPYLLAVDVKVGELAVSCQGAAEVRILDLLRHILDVAHRALLLDDVARDGLGSVLALRVSSGSLPSRRLLSRSSLGGGSRGTGLLGSSSSGGSGRSGSRSRGPALGLGRRRGRLGEGNDGARTGSSGGTAGPGHGFQRRGGLGRGSRLGRGRHRLRNGSRARLMGGLDLLDILLGKLTRRGIGVGGRGDNLDLGLGSLLGNLAAVHGDVGLGGLLKLLVNDGGIEVGSLFLDSLLLRLGLGHRGGSGLSGSLGSGRLNGGLGGLFLGLLIDVPQNIVEDKVARGLLSQNKGLDKLLGLSRLVGGLTDDLNDNILEGRLRVDVGDADLAVVEVELLDALLDSLEGG